MDRALSSPRLFRGALRPLSLLVAGGVTLHSANIYVASAVMPSVARDIGGLSLYAWATSLFVFAALLGSTTAAGVLGRVGVRDAYAGAMLTIAAGTTVCAVAPSMPMLLAGRFLQGCGGGTVFALAYALVRLMMPEAVWPRAMAMISAMWGVGTFLGPALGGTFAQLGTWRLAFWAVVLVTVAFAGVAVTRLPRHAGRRPDPAPTPTGSVATLGASVLVLSVASASHRATVNVAGLAAAALLAGAWLRVERRGPRRLLPASTFGADGRLRWLFVAMALLMAAGTPEIFIAYFGQEINGMSPLAAGYLGTALAVGWTGASLLPQGGARASSAILRGAPAVSLVGLLALTAVGSAGGDSPGLIASIVGGFVLLGAGIGLAWPRLVTAVLSAVPDEEGDIAGTAVTTVQLSAASFGAAAGGAIVNVAGLSDPGGVVGAQHAAAWLYPVLVAAPAAALLAIARTRRCQAPASAGPTVGTT